jgi:hypothetical protein
VQQPEREHHDARVERAREGVEVDQRRARPGCGSALLMSTVPRDRGFWRTRLMPGLPPDQPSSVRGLVPATGGFGLGGELGGVARQEGGLPR